MTPASPDRATVQRRLRLMQDALELLVGLEDITPERLQRNPIERAATERLLQVIIDLAIDVNAHLVVSLTGRSPETGRSSFTDLGACGVLPMDLANTIAPSAGMRNILVHHYVDIDPLIICEAVHTTTAAFPKYISTLATYLETAT